MTTTLSKNEKDRINLVHYAKNRYFTQKAKISASVNSLSVFLAIFLC